MRLKLFFLTLFLAYKDSRSDAFAIKHAAICSGEGGAALHRWGSVHSTNHGLLEVP